MTLNVQYNDNEHSNTQPSIITCILRSYCFVFTLIYNQANPSQCGGRDSKYYTVYTLNHNIHMYWLSFFPSPPPPHSPLPSPWWRTRTTCRRVAQTEASLPSTAVWPSPPSCTLRSQSDDRQGCTRSIDHVWRRKKMLNSAAGVRLAVCPSQWTLHPLYVASAEEQTIMNKIFLLQSLIPAVSYPLMTIHVHLSSLSSCESWSRSSHRLPCGTLWQPCPWPRPSCTSCRSS